MDVTVENSKSKNSIWWNLFFVLFTIFVLFLILTVFGVFNWAEILNNFVPAAPQTQIPQISSI